MKILRRIVTDDDLRAALDNAPPGIIDPRSWSYWNAIMGRYPPPPPLRRFSTRRNRDDAHGNGMEDIAVVCWQQRFACFHRRRRWPVRLAGQYHEVKQARDFLAYFCREW